MQTVITGAGSVSRTGSGSRSAEQREDAGGGGAVRVRSGEAASRAATAELVRDTMSTDDVMKLRGWNVFKVFLKKEVEAIEARILNFARG